MTENQIKEASQKLSSLLGGTPELAVVLGSGLGTAFKNAKVEKEVLFTDIPHFPKPTVEGHTGSFRKIKVGKASVLMQMGRIHFYEGLTPQQVGLPMRVLKSIGVKQVLLTNAAGGLKAKMRPGDLLIITDHINLTGQNPLIGANLNSFGPRFCDMSSLYKNALSKKLEAALKKLKLKYHRGVYCGVTGPSYETAAEIKFMEKIGGSAVGMSTVMEAIVARHCGLEIAGISAITNLGTGLSKEVLTHEDVQEQSAKNSKNLLKIVEILTS
jgi:purine-nucleoside phosphorylase